MENESHLEIFNFVFEMTKPIISLLMLSMSLYSAKFRISKLLPDRYSISQRAILGFLHLKETL